MLCLHEHIDNDLTRAALKMLGKNRTADIYISFCMFYIMFTFYLEFTRIFLLPFLKVRARSLSALDLSLLHTCKMDDLMEKIIDEYPEIGKNLLGKFNFLNSEENKRCFLKAR